MILHTLDARHVGGIETHVETIARSQRDIGLDARIVLWRAYENSPALERLGDCGVPLEIAGGMAGLRAILKRLRPGLLHTHGYKAGIAGRLAARLAGIPVVSTFHAGERGAGMVGLYQNLDEWTSFLGGRLAVSAQIAAQMPFSTAVIRNFVTPAHAPREVPRKPAFLFAGRLSHEKGPDLFASLARKHAASAHFAMLGDGPMRGDIEREAGDAVLFHGLVRDVGPHLDAASALVMTSRREGLPMIALEAMARGVPVIAPRIGALGELIRDGENGLLFPAEDLAAASACLERFLGLDSRAQAAMGEAAWQTVRDGYSPQCVLPVIHAAYAKAGYARGGVMAAPAAISA